MEAFAGIDLGTSSVKAVAVDLNGKVISVGQCEYDMQKPELNQAEQDMEELWKATVLAIRQMLGKAPGLCSSIKGIGFSGQMHGLVMVDAQGRLIDNAIIWADQRSEKAIEEIYTVIPKEEIQSVFCNRLSTGFLFPSLVWMKSNKPEQYNRISKVMLPKDYIRYRICGEWGTDVTDASSTGIWDMKGRQWAYPFLEKLGIPGNILVGCHESCEQAGKVTKECAAETGFREGTFVSYGGGDSLMMELGNGMVSEGRMASAIGTACHLTSAWNRLIYDPEQRMNIWCHSEKDRWSMMGAHLGGGIILKWLKQNVLWEDSFDNMTKQAEQVEPGSEGLLFLPYLNGERTPYNNPNARGICFGMNLKHRREHLIRSAMEGIVYSMKESCDIMRSLGVTANSIVATGGGSKSRLFRQIQADMYERPIYMNQEKEQAGIGAAITAAVGCGFYNSYQEACSRMVRFSDEVVYPIRDNVKVYEEGFVKFKELYKLNEPLFQTNA